MKALQCPANAVAIFYIHDWTAFLPSTRNHRNYLKYSAINQ